MTYNDWWPLDCSYELVTNSAKHAFTDGESGAIYINLEENDEEQLILTVNDNGRGLPPGLDLTNGKSLGIRIMNGLAAQLGGELTWIEQNKGTVVRLAFPKADSCRRADNHSHSRNSDSRSSGNRSADCRSSGLCEEGSGCIAFGVARNGYQEFPVAHHRVGVA